MRSFRAAKLAAGCVASVFLISGCSRPATPTIGEDGYKRFRNLLPGVAILYSSNIDGELEPCGCRSHPSGGIHRRWNVLHSKVKSKETLQLESGDLFYQSRPAPPFLLEQWNYQAQVLRKAYDEFGVEVMTPGELDFAAGFAQFESLARGAKFKIIATNLRRKDSKKPWTDPYVIVQKGGKKIGIFALFDETLPLPPELVADEHLAVAERTVKELRRSVDLVFALTHLGVEKDEELARKISGIDAIFGAHTQSYLHEPEIVGETLIFQTSFRGQHVAIYEEGDNALYQVDERFDSPADKPNPLDQLLVEARKEIARINSATEQKIEAESDASIQTRAFQTLSQCASCHEPQYRFHQKTRHAGAYETLHREGKQRNLECLRCHTVGSGQPGGWAKLEELVADKAGRSILAENFGPTTSKLSAQAIASKTSRSHLNVQCENCHGPGKDHPFSNMKFPKVRVSLCAQCHTQERAPGWYSAGVLNTAIANENLKRLTCPKSK